MTVHDKPLPPEHWDWVGNLAVAGKERMQLACDNAARVRGLDPDDYSWEDLMEELKQMAAKEVSLWEERQAQRQADRKAAEERRKAERQRLQEEEAAAQIKTVEFDDWFSFVEQFETLKDALFYVAYLPDGDELIDLADKCECTADKDLDWPEYRESVTAEIKECWPDD